MVISEHDNFEDKRRAMDVSCDEFMTKPYELDELNRHIQRLIQKSASHHPSGKLIYGDLILDQEAHRVSLSGRPIEVSLTEYSLLEYLMTNMNKVLTRKMILEHVWGATSTDTFANIVDVYINYLRKKIDKPGHRSFIKTVRGFGYMIEEAKQMAA